MPVSSVPMAFPSDLFALARRSLSAVLAFALALAPAAARAQADNLPRLGEAGAEELSPAAERRIGEQIMRALRRDVAVSDDAEVGEYLNRLAGRLAATPAASGFAFELFLVRDATLNAFALPGGYVYITRGIMAYLNSEAELAAVLGHEVGHVTARHAVRQQAGATATGAGATLIGILTGSGDLASLANFAGTALVRGYGLSSLTCAETAGSLHICGARPKISPAFGSLSA